MPLLESCLVHKERGQLEINYSYFESTLRQLTTEIVVPLRHKEVNEQAFNRLFELLNELSLIVKDEELINRNVVGLLFFIYTQLETQLAYSNKSQAEKIQPKRAKVLTYLRKVFGDIREN
jgi:UDP-N-acetylglucosamine:LPS N-acetylglucosamine transferase